MPSSRLRDLALDRREAVESGTWQGGSWAGLLAEMAEARATTLRLVEDLGEAELRLQPHPAFSPLGWHLGHVAWQEEVWLHRRVGGGAALRPEWEGLFDAARSEKASRGPRLPPPVSLYAYLEEVREHSARLLEKGVDPGEGLLAEGWVLRFLANHERQHAETMGALRLQARLPLQREAPAPPPRATVAVDPGWLHFAESSFVLGTDEDPERWDNESQAHRRHLAAFRLARLPVRNADWLEFIRAGGYRDPRLWSPEGWSARTRGGWEAPLHWLRQRDGSWLRMGLHGPAPLEPSHPVAHVSFFEAEAFAAFAGARLPTEAEWECAASWDPSLRRKSRWPAGEGPDPKANHGLKHGDTTPCGVSTSRCGAYEMEGNIWEWVSDIFLPYPGFQPGPYAAYSLPWFGAHRVLRGGSHLSHPMMARSTFRNWLPPETRIYPSGLRLAG